MPAAVGPCPQAAGMAGQLGPATDPTRFALEMPLAAPRVEPPEIDGGWSVIPEPGLRWPYHLPRWNAVDAFYWSMLARASYSPNASLILSVASWAAPVRGHDYAPPVAPPAVGHAFIELADCWLCVIPGTSSEAELLDYVTTHALELTFVNPVGGWSVNRTWWQRTNTVWQAAIVWDYPSEKPLIAIGHSSGGPEVGVLAARHSQIGANEPGAAVTFGAPSWSSPSLNDYVAGAKKPQVIEFTGPDDLVPRLPPPWSALDVAGINHALTPRPTYTRVGTLLELRGTDGAFVRENSSFAAAYSAMQHVLRRDLGGADHAAKTYTDLAASWAQNWCAEQGTPDLIDGLLAVKAVMDAGNL